jgi:serine/threonine protein kinase
MGACLSGGGGASILSGADGDQEAYEKRFVEDRVLGQGEFGVVKLVHEKANGTESAKTGYACKTLRKGAVFKDNVLYSPMPVEVLKGEVDMLRALAGKHYCLRCVAVFETPKAILLVTECCSGGEMMEYVAKQTEDLRTEDVSRISFQLLDSVNHCAKHHIIHRDIKPENAMFETANPGAGLRLIDFGSGTLKEVEGMHTTFAGTPFYNSPEMFTMTYTQRTDVWSVGVVLYVLVAGYPTDALQKAFNLLLNAKRKDVKGLPNLPDDMPAPYYDMLDKLLVYRHKQRTAAGEMLNHEFVQFHLDLLKEDGKEDASGEILDTVDVQKPMPTKRPMGKRQMSKSVQGSVRRHSLFFDFKKYERSLTTIMATLLSQVELRKLITILNPDGGQVNKSEGPKLQVILISELKAILETQIKSSSV